jgi:hydrogenase maturation protease
VTQRVLVAGIGNVLMGDDAIGPYCARQLMARYEFPAHVEVADLGTPGLDLVLHLSSADVVLLIDALREAAPGTIAIYHLSTASTRRTGLRLDTHAPALEESLFVARLTGHRPAEVRLIGLAGERFGHGTGLTACVRAGMPALMDAVLLELTRLGIESQPRARATSPDVWWELPALP